MTILPFIPSVAAYEFSVEIDGVAYTFVVRWNSRAAAWYFDVLEADGTPIARGLKVVLGCYIGGGRTHDLFRLGAIVAVDTAQEGRDATFDDLGTRVEVRHLPMHELIGRASGTGAQF